MHSSGLGGNLLMYDNSRTLAEKLKETYGKRILTPYSSLVAIRTLKVTEVLRPWQDFLIRSRTSELMYMYMVVAT